MILKPSNLSLKDNEGFCNRTNCHNVYLSCNKSCSLDSNSLDELEDVHHGLCLHTLHLRMHADESS